MLVACMNCVSLCQACHSCNDSLHLCLFCLWIEGVLDQRGFVVEA